MICYKTCPNSVIFWYHFFCCYRTWSLQEAKDEGKRIIFGRQFQPLCCTSQLFIRGLKWAKRNWKWFLTESSSVIIKVKNRKNRYWSLRKTGLTHLSKGPNDHKLSGAQLMHHFWLSISCYFLWYEFFSSQCHNEKERENHVPGPWQKIVFSDGPFC